MVVISEISGRGEGGIGKTAWLASLGFHVGKYV